MKNETTQTYTPTFLVTMEQALEALDNMDDYARMDMGVNAYGPMGVLKSFIEQSKQNPDQASPMEHLAYVLTQDLINIYKALGLDVDEHVDAEVILAKIKSLNTMTKEDEQAINSLSMGYEKGVFHEATTAEDEINILTAMIYVTSRLHGMLTNKRDEK